MYLEGVHLRKCEGDKFLEISFQLPKMSEAAILSTCDVPTAAVCVEQPLAGKPPILQQIEIVVRTWKMEDMDVMQKYGIKLFKQ